MQVLILLLGLTFFSVTTPASNNQEGYVLSELWENYQKARKADRPQDQLNILQSIKSEALSRQLVLDYCDAATLYAQVRRSMNWKLSDSLTRNLEAELKAFPLGIARVYTSPELKNTPDSMSAYIKDKAEELKTTKNSILYHRDSRISGGFFGTALPYLLKNDYEYALWCLYSATKEEVPPILSEAFGSRYPFNAIYEFSELLRLSYDRDKLEDFLNKYNGKATAGLAEQKILELELEKLQESEAKSEDYVKLYNALTTLSQRLSTFTGEEQLLADIGIKACEKLSEQLHEKKISAYSENGELTVIVRNIDSVRVDILQNKTLLHDFSVLNQVKSFYAFDTLNTELPALKDGEYSIKISSSDKSTFIEHKKYRLSIASRNDSEGTGVYIADYISGKPLETCSLILRNDADSVVAQYNNFSIEGFTYLPEEISSAIPNQRLGYTLQAAYTENGETRLSPKLSLNSGYSFINEEDYSTLKCELLLDRRAFNPDETLHYKAILYSGKYNFKLCEPGTEVTARLLDPQNKELASEKLCTNEFGSVSGSFVLKKSLLGGQYTLRIEKGGKPIESKQIVVDEFVLPTFNLSWTPDERFYLPGDSIKVRGNIQSYSGHSLNAVQVSYSVLKNSETFVSGNLETDSEGNLSFSFPSDSERSRVWYEIIVKVVDLTGETLEFSKSVFVNPNLRVNIDSPDKVEGKFSLKDDSSNSDYQFIFTQNEVNLELCPEFLSSRPEVLIDYTLSGQGEILKSGTAKPGTFSLNLTDPKGGLYEFSFTARTCSDSGEEYSESGTANILHLGQNALPVAGISSFFMEHGEDELSLSMGASCGSVWAVGELFGNGNILLDRKLIYLDGKAANQSSLTKIEFEHKETYPEELSIKLFYFRDCSKFDYSKEFDFKEKILALPLEFVRFTDTTAPSEEYSFTIKTEAGVECVASIFDASTETLMDNSWNRVSPRKIATQTVSYESESGKIGSGSIFSGIITRSARGTRLADTDNIALFSESATSVESEESLEAEVQLRQDFKSTLAWEPFLRSDENGDISLNFKTSDQLSQYYVQVFAHDKNFRNSTLRREMTVTLPVKVSIVRPQYLYEGDSWVAKASISNNLDTPISGKVSINFSGLSSADKVQELIVPGKGSVSFSAALDIPDIDSLGVMLSFRPDSSNFGSDALFVSIPVLKPEQSLTEAHSSLLLPDSDKTELILKLRGQFVNADGDSASVQEISIKEMLLEAIPKEIHTENQDVLSLSASLRADHLLQLISDLVKEDVTGLKEAQKSELIEKILACHNSDGGFAWFKDMNSSPVITATLLERFYRMQEACPSELSALIPSAIKYLDKKFFTEKASPLWLGGISMEEYLYVRAMFPEVEPDIKALETEHVDSLGKKIVSYLVPSDKAGLEGMILQKAKRLSTLKLLLSSKKGIELAGKLGGSEITKKRLQRSLSNYIESLSQYAEDHPEGGKYYPNAVMPSRGLLESELYAHTLLCNLMEDSGREDIAEGIRFWIMLQKETQKWKDDSGYIEALHTVLQAKEETLNTKVVALSGEVSLPFEEIKASGNGFTIEKEFYLNGKRIEDGQILKVGDKLTAVYKVWSGENRSFVRLSAYRPANLRPVQQLSGLFGSPFRFLSVSGYRSVRTDKTEYWFEVYPEADTSIEEEFYVTQEGRFQCPAIEIESFYAKHYRANEEGNSQISSKSESFIQP